MKKRNTQSYKKSQKPKFNEFQDSYMYNKGKEFAHEILYEALNNPSGRIALAQRMMAPMRSE